MNIFSRKIGNLIGLDKSIAYSSGSRIVSGVAGVVTIFFISAFLTGVEQGFYFTFGSLLAMQVFFELGLTGIMTQYVAHEASHLKLVGAEYKGEFIYKSRLASLVHFCYKWYLILALLVFIFLVIVGLIYFHKYGSSSNDVSWQVPWLIICFGTAIKLFQSPFNSILIGLGKVKEMSKIGFYQQLIIPMASWLGLAVGLKLHVVGIGYLLSVIIWHLFIWKTGNGRILYNLWYVQIVDRVDYIKEIFPYQWKIAVSWISGYFIFQLFNPVLFATDGPVVAGQMGMTMSVLSSISALSMSWMNTKIPLYSKLIALKDYHELDEIFNKTLKQMSSICAILLLFFFLFIVLLNVTQLQYKGSLIANRFLGYLPLLLLIIPVIVMLYISSWATYLRCHKKEPFLVISIVSGLLCMASTIFFGKLYGLLGVTISYCLIQMLILPWGFRIYCVYKKKWHDGE